MTLRALRARCWTPPSRGGDTHTIVLSCLPRHTHNTHLLHCNAIKAARLPQGAPGLLGPVEAERSELGLTVLAAADSLRNGSKAACWHRRVVAHHSGGFLLPARPPPPPSSRRYARLELVQDDAGAWAYREGGLQRRTVGGMGELAGGTGERWCAAAAKRAPVTPS